MKAVIFDLDDTLYPEIEFVKSGFHAVAIHLVLRHRLNKELLIQNMLDIMKDKGRGEIFDELLNHLGFFSKQQVELLVSIYRSHQPKIKLFNDALPLLRRLKRYKMSLGIVTDGMASVQRNKVQALGLDKIFKAIVYTDEIGKGFSKPSIVPFEKILKLLRVKPAGAVYIGDNPKKDFIGPNSIGMLTIQINRGKRQARRFKKSVIDSSGARHIVSGLNEILPVLLNKKNAGN